MRALPVNGNSALSSGKEAGERFSTAEMARAKARESPARTCSTQLFKSDLVFAVTKLEKKAVNVAVHQSFSNWRAITSLWISLVPSPIVHSFTSR